MKQTTTSTMTTLSTDLPSLPFSVTVTEEKFDNVPDYMCDRNPDKHMDYPCGPVMIDGEYWIIYKNGDKPPVYRFKGTSIENAVRQPDGTGEKLPVSRPYILGGMWYNAKDKILYAPMHCEVAHYAGIVKREIHLASSADKGLTWKYEGALLTANDPKNPRLGPEYSGLQFDGGDGDHTIFVDERGGYIYIYTSHYLQVKIGSPGKAFLRHRVARCAIADKMAPGKWKRFYNGEWNEPGIGGKASYVNAFTVTYNTYLKKHLSFNYMSGLSWCDDMSTQDWSPSFHFGDAWGINGIFGFWATNAEKNDTSTSGQTLYVYRFWKKNLGRRFRIDLGQGQTPARLGFSQPSLYLPNRYTAFMVMTLDPGSSYGPTPFFESSDPIEARRTRRIEWTSGEVKYQGNWTDCEGKTGRQITDGVASVEFTFTGRDIYWRAGKGPDHGRAEVFLDGALQTTVDCWASVPTELQFAFIKRGLDGTVPHTIKIVAKNEKGPLSSGTVIRHILFEHAADSWRASDCFSSIQGQNQWSQLQSLGESLTDLTFADPVWKSAEGCEIGYFHMKSGVSAGAVRKWTAPHDGKVRLEGAPAIDSKTAESITVSVKKNAEDVWSAKLLHAAGEEAGKTAKDGKVEKSARTSHDFELNVIKGDSVFFIVRRFKNPAGDQPDALPATALKTQAEQASLTQVLWDPAVTYIESTETKK